MSDRLHVITRKGLFEVRRRPSGAWEIAEPHFYGQPLSMCLATEDALYAALDLGHFGAKLHRSRDGGKTWTEIACPRFPGAPVQPAWDPSSGEPPPPPVSALTTDPDAPSLERLWSLESDGKGGLWAGGVPAGLFHSADGGDSWTLCESLWSVPERKEWGGAGNNTPALHTILVEKGDPNRIVVAISTGGVYRTEDGGRTWDGEATGWRADYFPPELESVHYRQDVHRVGRCAAEPRTLWAQHHNGVFRSTDGGKAWTEIKDVKPSVFGFAVAAHPKDPETAWFVPAQKDEVRAPVGGRFVVNRTRDGGRTFETLTAGLPNTAAYDLVYRHGLDVDGSGERLAMGSTTGGLWVSESGGERWTLLSAHLPPIYGVRFAPS